MKLFLTVALSLSLIALIAHAQQAAPPYPPPAYPPPSSYPPPPPNMPPPDMPPPGAAQMIPPPPDQAPAAAPAPSPQQAVSPATAPAQDQSQTSSAAALQPQQQGNVTFVSGGAGDEDRAALQQVESQYNLRLLFAAANGDYLANVDVTLADAQGHAVLDTIADGPIFYAHVPPGRYKLTVSNQGQSQSRTVTVGASGAVSQDFHWASAG